MGNCLSSQDADDISLIRDNEVSDNRSSSSSETERPRPSRTHAHSHSRTSHSHSHGAEPSLPVEPPPPYQEAPVVTIYHPSPSISRTASQLTEEEQVQIAQRLGLISHLPLGVYDGTNKKAKECVICMVEFDMGDMMRFLPCMHVYHRDCIDDWLMRSFTCPSCMEPVHAALLSSYETS